MSATQSPLVENDLRRLDAALAGLPADQRHEITEGVAQHVADARLRLEQDEQNSDEVIRVILDQLGDPHAIAAEALETGQDSVTATSPPLPSVTPSG